VDYGLIIALVAVVVIVGLTLVGGKANTLFTDISNKLTMTRHPDETLNKRQGGIRYEELLEERGSRAWWNMG
jgi:hypothetical protein